tara:strand:- start:1645 stop:1896 length:252 start_codon:yes stop_codon:yes gene_type:complete
MGMSTEELGVLFGGISSILAVLIYFTKNLKESECCGARCKQTVLDSHGDPVRSTVNCLDQAMATFPPAPATAPAYTHPMSAII